MFAFILNLLYFVIMEPCVDLYSFDTPWIIYYAGASHVTFMGTHIVHYTGKNVKCVTKKLGRKPGISGTG